MVIPYDTALFDIQALLCEEIPRLNPHRLTEDTDLRNDLRMDYFDAQELMVRYFERFNIKPNNFSFDAYFPITDDIDLINGFIMSLFDKKYREPFNLRRLTVGMLAYAASIGEWVDNAPP